jgi:hypothetical protein
MSGVQENGFLGTSPEAFLVKNRPYGVAQIIVT